MNVFDWIFIAALALGLVIGLIKGFLKPLLSAIGFVVIAFGSSALAPVLQGWLMGVEMGDAFRPLLSIIISVVILTVVWVLISLVLRKIITAQKGMGIINRAIGAVLGIVIVYLVFAVMVAYFVTLGGLTPNLTEKFGSEIAESWIRAHIYTDKGNFFGNWVTKELARRLLEIIQDSQNNAASVAEFFQNIIA